MKRTNSYLSATIAILIVIASFWYSKALLIPKVQSENAKLAQAQSDSQSADAYLSELTRSKSVIASLGDLPSLLSLAIPGDKDTPNLITELESVAAKNKMTIPSIQTTDSTTNDDATTTPSNTVDVSFTVAGSFIDVSAFITALENDIRFMNIQSITMTSVETEAGSSSGAVSLSLQLQTYKRVSAAVASASSTEGEL